MTVDLLLLLSPAIASPHQRLHATPPEERVAVKNFCLPDEADR